MARFAVGEAVLSDETLVRDFAGWRVQYEGEYAAWHTAQNEAARGNSLRRLMQSDAMRILERLGHISTRRFDAYDEIAGIATEELEKLCSRNGSLLDDPVCPSCRLLWGQRVKLRDLRELEQIVESGIKAFRQAIGEETAVRFLQHRAPEILEWNGEVSSLLPLLSNETLRVLDEAFAPRRVLKRSWNSLEEAAKMCHTRGEFRTLFLQWLDGDDAAHDEDEIELADLLVEEAR